MQQNTVHTLQYVTVCSLYTVRYLTRIKLKSFEFNAFLDSSRIQEFWIRILSKLLLFFDLQICLCSIEVITREAQIESLHLKISKFRRFGSWKNQSLDSKSWKIELRSESFDSRVLIWQLRSSSSESKQRDLKCFLKRTMLFKRVMPFNLLSFKIESFCVNHQPS